jgi:hypothetical protein
MYRLLLFLAPAVLVAGEARHARLGEMEGKVDVQIHAADPWSPAERNLTLIGDTWLRTAAGSRVEIELDEGSALRLGPDSMVELSDYTRLSTGQRITLLSLDRGVAWFTGEPSGQDALSLAVPGAQILFLQGARVRIEAGDTWSRLTVIEGVVRLTCPAAELDVREGQSARVEPANTSRFSLERGIEAMDLDRWSEERDKHLETSVSSSHVGLKYGLKDLDAGGQWLETDIGPVWKPRTAEGWAPFQKGRWRWYDTLGYTWVSDEPWGWTPYHYGRWTRKNDLGWVWAPPSKPVFKPGDVYWLYGRNLAGWGPLAPGEEWAPSAAPQQFLNVNTTYATFVPDARVIDPAGFTARPKEPLGAAVFAQALPSPAMLPSRLEARRPALRVGATKPIAAIVPGTTLEAEPTPPPPDLPPAVVTNPASDAPPVVQPGPPYDPSMPPPPIVYPVPVYTGVVVINPPEHPDYSRPNPNRPAPARPQPQQPATQPNRPDHRGNQANDPQPQSPAGRPSQPGNRPTTPAATTPPVITPPRGVEPPRVGSPAPQRTDRPRMDSPPPRVEQPRLPTRETPPPAPRTESKAEASHSKPETKSESKPEQPKPSATTDRTSRKQ